MHEKAVDVLNWKDGEEIKIEENIKRNRLCGDYLFPQYSVRLEFLRPEGPFL